jgi:putative SOS response-associated peptidase YedK
MAGIYRIEDGAPAFAILTREPAEAIAFIHDRMPVILPENVRDAWLDTRNDARDVLKAALTDLRFVVA